MSARRPSGRCVRACVDGRVGEWVGEWLSESVAAQDKDRVSKSLTVALALTHTLTPESR
mgnify:CR=1 FL=1